MRLPEPQRKPAAESVVPMINVVFLLLIFFLMTAQITPPAPFEVEPPAGESEQPAETGLVLHMDDEGRVAFRDTEGLEVAVEALAAERRAMCGECDEDAPPVLLRADAGAAAADVAALLPRLGSVGIEAAELVTVMP